MQKKALTIADAHEGSGEAKEDVSGPSKLAGSSKQEQQQEQGTPFADKQPLATLHQSLVADLLSSANKVRNSLVSVCLHD